MKYKTILFVALLAFAVSLAVVVGQRLSSEAMAVIVGVVAGVAASIPTSLIVVWAALRNRGEARVVDNRRPEAPEPRIVVMAPPPTPPANAAPARPSYYAPAEAGLRFEPGLPRHAGRREFTVIGGAGSEETL